MGTNSISISVSLPLDMLEKLNGKNRSAIIADALRYYWSENDGSTKEQLEHRLKELIEDRDKIQAKIDRLQAKINELDREEREYLERIEKQRADAISKKNFKKIVEDKLANDQGFRERMLKAKLASADTKELKERVETILQEEYNIVLGEPHEVITFVHIDLGQLK